MEKSYEDRILERMKEPDYRPVKVRTLARELDIPADEYAAFRAAVGVMLEEGRIVEGRANNLKPPAEKKNRTDEIVGKYAANPRGFGFVTPEDAVPGAPREQTDIHIPAGESRDAMNGDTVVVRLQRGHGARERKSGIIVKVLHRGISRLVGTLRVADGVTVVRPDGNKYLKDVPVPDASAKGARPGDKVVFELVKYAGPNQDAEGVVVEVIGAPGEPGVDALAVLRQFDIPDVFPAEAIREAHAAAEKFEPDTIEGREDLRGRTIVTIDPATARDFDDAISLTHGPDGIWELGVHIADVAHFVTEGSALDEEAKLRGNSVYLPKRVVPMLPEVLSNGVCSLQQDVDRLCKTAFIRLDGNGKVVGERFAETVIRNQRRFSYEQVTEVLAGRADLAPPAVNKLIADMDRLAKIILERRRRDGLLELNLPVVQLVYDQNNKVVDAVPENQDFSHRIIEMFMIEANEAVARWLYKQHRPTLRRIHEDPDQAALLALRRFLKTCGLKVGDVSDRAELQMVLRSVAGTPKQFAVHLAALRSMRQAVYSPDDEGHYALASRHYLHFTSPIRRYPDLIVHRAFARAVAEHGRKRKDVTDEEVRDIRVLAKHCSTTERRAEEVEREYRTAKVLELLSTMVGEELDGVITGVTGYGLFVQSTKYLIDGLVHLSTMDDDFYEVDDKTGSVQGRRTRKVLRIGDPVRVRIIAADVPRRKLDFAIAGTGLAASAERTGPGSDRIGGRPGRSGPPLQRGGRGRSRRGPSGDGERGGRGGRGPHGGSGRGPKRRGRR